MGIFNRIFGDDEQEQQNQAPRQQSVGGNRSGTDQSADEQAIARYRYMLKTAPPETIEQAHAEAFAQLTPKQRQMVLAQLATELPAAERQIAAQSGDDPQTLARLATRAEVRQPGTIERVFGGFGGSTGGFGGGMGLGGLVAGSFLSSLAGTVIGSYIAQQFFDNDPNYFADDFGSRSQEFGGADNNQNFGTEDNYDASIQNDYASEPQLDNNALDTEVNNFEDIGSDFGDFDGDFGGSDF